METLCRLSYRGRAELGVRVGTDPPRYTLRRSQGESESEPDERSVRGGRSGRCSASSRSGLLEVAEQLDDRALLARSRCFGWTRLDLLAHVHLGRAGHVARGWSIPTDAEPDTDAASYWRTEPPTNDPDSDELDNVRFARLLASAYRRPTGLIGHLRPTVHGVVRAVEALSAPAVSFQGHVLSSGDFLATWATELAVHHLDLDLDRASPVPTRPLFGWPGRPPTPWPIRPLPPSGTTSTPCWSAGTASRNPATPRIGSDAFGALRGLYSFSAASADAAKSEDVPRSGARRAVGA